MVRKVITRDPEWDDFFNKRARWGIVDENGIASAPTKMAGCRHTTKTYERQIKMLGKMIETAKNVRDFGFSMAIPRAIRQRSGGLMTISTKYGRFRVRNGDSDLDVLRQVFVLGEYGFERLAQGAIVMRAYKDIVSRGKTPIIIDAGANVGFASCYFQYIYPLAKIFAVEPDRDNAALCRENTAHLDGVEVIEAAIGSVAGFVETVRDEKLSWGIRTIRSEAGVQVVTINDLLEKETGGELLIAKIDIEGFESDLFARSTEWVGKAWLVIVEPHDWMLPNQGSSFHLQEAMLAQRREILVLGESLAWFKRD